MFLNVLRHSSDEVVSPTLLPEKMLVFVLPQQNLSSPKSIMTSLGMMRNGADAASECR